MGPANAARSSPQWSFYAHLHLRSCGPSDGPDVERSDGVSLQGLDFCWPTSESVLYQEPKRLVRLGLATAKREATGRRTRTVYTITEQGR